MCPGNLNDLPMRIRYALAHQRSAYRVRLAVISANRSKVLVRLQEPYNLNSDRKESSLIRLSAASQ